MPVRSGPILLLVMTLVELCCRQSKAQERPLCLPMHCSSCCNECGKGQMQVYLARGKVLGGSSATNATLYMRGTQADYDSWNVPGWGSKEALQGFIACEDNENGELSRMHFRSKGYQVMQLIKDMLIAWAQG